ncbi:OLC1v1035998C1 [Oldenlandia corymbosa var. corymbosa]|uniref:OLC1v1035998C1 n=1 Tax=Oldenlandia corymbosa var. corymbosa TaxID=529605 RepID=A0AAV1CVN3_OLDCO|nr:OLC1v1035998C1 [Oldenlandia corymbosa var. corymbosa]
MAMTRLLSQTLIHPAKSSAAPLSPIILTHRYRSGKAQNAQIIEVDLDGSSSSSSAASSDVEKISGGMRKLEEVIQNIIVRRSAPDWLPFRPGSSYWVPPPSQNIRNSPFVGVAEVLGRLSDAARVNAGEVQSHSRSLAFGGSSSISELLSPDEAMSIASSRSWPSSSYFIEGIAPSFPVMEAEVEVELKILDNTKGVSSDEDEQG